jgi:tetratricopeptide (TPR) repeat protein
MKTKARKVFILALVTVLAAAVALAVAAGDSKKKLSDEDENIYELAYESALAHYEKANLLYKKDKTDETIKELQAIADIDFPKGTEDRDGFMLQLDSRSFLAELLIGKGQPDKAVDVLKPGIKQAPDASRQTYQMYMTLGHAYKEMKKTDDALAAFEKAAKINNILRKQKEAEDKKKKDAEK